MNRLFKRLMTDDSTAEDNNNDVIVIMVKYNCLLAYSEAEVEATRIFKD